MKLALAGFMAVGKSTVGKLLAEHLGLDFVDLDQEIERQTGYTIPQLFAISEDLFRLKEEETLRILLNQDDIVLALGGGTLHSRENAQLILHHFQLFTFHASWDVLEQRILGSGRPLADQAKELFKQRKQGYEAVGIQIQTDRRSPERVMLEIVKQLGKEKYENSVQKF